MGKKGDALRAAKKQNRIYRMTAEQLERSNRLAIEAYKQDIEARMQEQADKYVREYFTKIGAEFETGDDDTDAHTVVNYMLSVCIRVLIEDFGWKPPRCANCRRTKTERFMNRVVEVIDDIRSDDTKDIRDYAKETEDMYGIAFRMKEE